MKIGYDTKSYHGEVKDIDFKGRRVSGYLSSFDNVDSDDDVIVKGAYKRTLEQRKDNIFFLNQHNWSQPHGKFDELTEDDFGLFFVSNKMTDVTYSLDALKLYEAGILKEHSVGFNVVQDEVKDGVRVIKEIKLYEGSNVTLGANSLTPFRGFKSATLKDIQDETKKFLKAYRQGTFTDETFGLLEIAIKQLQNQAYEMGKNHSDPSKDTRDPIVDHVETLKQFRNTFTL